MFFSSYVYLLYYVCIAVLTLDAGLLARSQYPEGPATGHLDTGSSSFPCVYKRMLRWFPSFQLATTWKTKINQQNTQINSGLIYY